MSLMPASASPRFLNSFMNDTATSPPGSKEKMASGFASAARWRKGAYSMVDTGVRTLPITLPPAPVKALVNQVSASIPGP